ncbi:KTSC domain-containing protein [Flavobacterium sp.]|uniref:KTSC domain-containing protein n=1 Tax=Flavobacterium sp. TaxID=239 RepID=UPI00286AF44E|nr:KTSC domain-containing protein [Flavobacterium sp.]
MKRYQVCEPNIVSVGYDEVNEILEIEFKLQTIHHYLGVPLNEYVALMKAKDIEVHYFDFVHCQYHFNVF